MATLTLDLDDLLAGDTGDASDTGDGQEAAPSYWRAANHDPDNYLRAEQWLQDVGEFVLPSGRTAAVPLAFDSAQAVLRYREELKMYAALEDQARAARALRPTEPPEALHDPAWLDAQHARIAGEWPPSRERGPWWAALERLREALDVAVRECGGEGEGGAGAFVKLSVRSPKDAVFDLTATADMMREAVRASALAPGDPETLSEDVRIIKQATWRAMAVRSGAEALQLLLRSDRVYTDVLQHGLFNKEGAFDLAVHVREFVTCFDPAFEFRGFVSGGVRTALTAYSPWVYDPRIVERREQILEAVTRLWDTVQPRIRSDDYSVDFAVAPDGSGCWLVEVNNFLPPLAGAGAFVYEDAADREIIERGPFEFRIVTAPITSSDFVRKSVDEATGKTRTRVMMPAPAHIMALLEEWRRPEGSASDSGGCAVS